ncbi:MAG: hypothetical protein ACSLFR_14860 [Solirubrobacteraceae bacterium]
MTAEHEYEIDGPLIEEVFRLTATEERTPLPRHRHNLTRSQVETAQRARIIVATAEVVNELGYAAASSASSATRHRSRTPGARPTKPSGPSSSRSPRCRC